MYIIWRQITTLLVINGLERKRRKMVMTQFVCFRNLLLVAEENKEDLKAVDFRTEIWTQDFQNTYQMCCCFDRKIHPWSLIHRNGHCYQMMYWYFNSCTPLYILCCALFYNRFCQSQNQWQVRLLWINQFNSEWGNGFVGAVRLTLDLSCLVRYDELILKSCYGCGLLVDNCHMSNAISCRRCYLKHLL
jgi:hypothetical protein